MTGDVPLRRNRNFTLLWSGQVVSELGGRVSAIAFPLLVLALSGSPARAGIVGFAETLPLLVLTLPAGALVDRWDRKRVMITADSACLLAMASIPIGLALGALPFAQIVMVAAVIGTGYAFSAVAEQSALRNVVADTQLPAAMARNQARIFGALLVGQPLGGALFALGRWVPFLFDAMSYLVSVLTLLFVRTSFQAKRESRPAQLGADVRAGLSWFWRQPFIRATSLITMGTDFTVNALYLVVIVLARDRGAGPALIGAMFVFLGLGGVVGALIAPGLVRRLRTRTIVVACQVLVAGLIPLLIVVPGRLAPGVIYGAMFLLHPTWNASVSTYRLRTTPDHLIGRVTSIGKTLSLGPVALASLGSGLLLEAAGVTPTLWVLFAVIMVTTVAAAVSPAVRQAPARLRDVQIAEPPPA
ncbi:MAG: MFS transporter [Actinomycetota bacterium]|nr:MFS transporter [Actinomycetota bacterium]